MATLVDHLKAKNNMNPKVADLAVNLGHMNAAALKDLIDFIRSGETTEAIVEAPAPAPEAAPETPADETPAEESTDTPSEN